MENNFIGECPVCSNRLTVTKLSCRSCGLELLKDFEMTPFDYLNKEQYDFIIAFLKKQGNLKALQDEKGITYLTAKKNLENVLQALNLIDTDDLRKDDEMFNFFNIKTNPQSTKASEIIKLKLIKNGGTASVQSINGKFYDIKINRSGEAFECKALPINPPYNFSIFDLIISLLLRQGGKADKGNGRNHRLGEKNCDETTVVGLIGYEYAGKQNGDSIFDPVFVLAAVLAWAGICNNKRGYLELTAGYKQVLK